MIYQIKDGYKQFGMTSVFEGVNFNVSENDKIALVGRNGAGKTTLMKIITNSVDLDSGDIFKNNDLEVGYLSQTTLDNDSHTIIEEVVTVFDKVKELEKKIRDISLSLEKDKLNEKLLNEYSYNFAEFEMLGGYNYEYEMYQVLSQFGFTGEFLEMQVGDLSGGERTKVAFAKLLLKKPQLLLLDEPTNHLDLSTIEWLEGYLRQYKRAMIIVSHDRVFLDNIATKVWEIEYGKLKLYPGNYSNYEIEKKTFLSSQKTAYLQQQREIKRLEDVIAKFRYKPSKASFAQSKIKYLEKMDKIELDKTDESVFKARFTPKVRGGNKVLELNDLSIGYETVLATLSLQLFRGDRLGIIGDNGTGKSTLVKTLMEKIQPLAGEMLWGHNIETAYFDQQLAQVDSNKTVLDEIWDTYPDLTQSEVRTLLGNFLFRAEDVFKTIKVLSGGEKVRLSLLKVMLSKSNCLVLDEPTNHLDILSKEALEQAIKQYAGTIIFVSHDRHFIDSVANKILLIRKDGIKLYPGTYSDYKNRLEQDALKLEAKVIVNQESLKEKPKSKLSYSNNWIKTKEKEISKLEKEINSLKAKTFKPEYYEDYKVLEDLNNRIDNNSHQLEETMLEYLDYLEWKEYQE